MSNPIVTSLPAYVEQNRLPLLAKSVLKAKSASLFTLMTEVKGETALNLVDTDVVFKNGAECGFENTSSTTYSQRNIKPQILKVNASYCPKKLLGKWAAYQVATAADEHALPFEEEFVNGLTDGIKEGIEKMIWQGAANSSDEFEGLISIISTAKTSTPEVNDASTVGAYQFIKDVYNKMPEAVVSKEDAVILVGAGIYREFIQSLVAQNLYHYNPADGGNDMEYTLPGTSVRVIAVNGLNNTATYDHIYAGRLSNFFYGCDIEDGEEHFDLFWSADDRVFKFISEFVAGTQIAYPDEVVWGRRAK